MDLIKDSFTKGKIDSDQLNLRGSRITILLLSRPPPTSQALQLTVPPQPRICVVKRKAAGSRDLQMAPGVPYPSSRHATALVW